MDSRSQPEHWSAVILAGGRGSRIGGQDKASVTLGGVPTLDWILRSLPSTVEVVVVAPPREVSRQVTFCLEEPRFGGPVAALAAALLHVTTPLVAVLGGDMPRGGELAVRLVEELQASGGPGLLPVDVNGRRQPLGMVVPAHRIRRALARLQPIDGRAMHELTAQLDCVERRLEAEESAWLQDFDTERDLRELRAAGGVASGSSTSPTSAAADGVHMSLERWVQELREELSIEDDIDVDAILDLARVAAHGVQRPAAPLTAYMLGLAVARGTDFALAAAAIELSASSWVKSGEEEPK